MRSEGITKGKVTLQPACEQSLGAVMHTLRPWISRKSRSETQLIVGRAGATGTGEFFFFFFLTHFRLGKFPNQSGQRSNSTPSHTPIGPLLLQLRFGTLESHKANN